MANFPAMGMRAQVVSEYAAGYHAICEVSWKSLVMEGTAWEDFQHMNQV